MILMLKELKMLNNFSIFTLCVAIGSLALTGCQKPDTKADVKTDTPVAASAAMDHSKMTHDNMAVIIPWVPPAVIVISVSES